MEGKEMKASLVVILLIVVTHHAAEPQPPEPVVSLRQRILSKEAYVTLANQWLEYIQQHGPTAEAYANVGQAYRYAGEPKELFLEYYKKAVDADSLYARALDLYGCHLWNHGSEAEKERALAMLERARIVDPGYEESLYSLYSVYCCTKRLDEAEKTAQDIFRRGLIPPPIQDFGYNLLAGLPEDAVLITNGDNDTYPPLSLQAGMGFRRDVVVLNQSLLGCMDYVQALEERYRDWFPSVPNETNKGPFSVALYVIRALIDSGKRPVYIAITVPFDRLGLAKTMSIEGVCARVDNLTQEKIETDFRKSYELLESVYRLDSASNWAYPWDLRSAERMLMKNYVAVAYRAAQGALDAGRNEIAERLVAIGLHLARFHGEDLMVEQLTRLVEEQ
jgi:hypothetical protein